MGSSEGHEVRYSKNPFPVFSTGGPCEQLWHGQGRPLFNIVHPAFPLSTTASPTLQGVPKNGFGEAVVACGMPEPCKFPLLTVARRGSCGPRGEVDLVPHPVVGLVPQVRDMEKFPHALDFESLNLCFFQSANRIHVSQP